MPQRIEERVRPITPQLAWRVAVLGGIAFVLFAIVFFRLWFLQVLSGQDYVSIARDNRVRKVRIEAPRGDIVDRNNVKLVRTKRGAGRAARAVQAPGGGARPGRRLPQGARGGGERPARSPSTARPRSTASCATTGTSAPRPRSKQQDQLKKDADAARPVAVPELPGDEEDLAELYRRVGEVLEISPKTIHRRVIRGIADAPYSNVTIRTDVPPAEFNYMRERPEYFPGVVVTNRYLRLYPKRRARRAAVRHGLRDHRRAAQFREDDYAGIEQGTRIGQSGLEKWYDKYLRGVDGSARVVVDAFGSRDEQRKTTVTNPEQGQRLKLTLDYDLQTAGDEALSQAIAASPHGAKAGAYVAMDLRDGAILAMGSQPRFDASVFAKPFSQKTYDFLTSDKTGAPLLDRATESAYPTGSVFKPITALAALDSGIVDPDQIINDDGKYELGPQKYQNAKGAAFGPINIKDALTVSSDVFFYHLGEWADAKGTPIQRWAKRLGFGRKTGIDIPGERPGLVPDSKWRTAAYERYKACTEKANLDQGTTAALYECGGVEKGWTTGDNVNLAVGQGDLQATPLQVAVAYAAIANNGTIVTPHLGKAIEDGNGAVLQELRTKPQRKIKLDPAHRQIVLDGLRQAANSPQGTSSDVFKDFPKQYTVYGKTGTAERQPNPDQSWYACFVKDKNRPIVVVVTVERGGFGAETAAPAARLILSEWFDVDDDREFHAGTDQSN